MRNWKDCVLADLGEIVGGATPSTKNESYYGGDIAWITPKDLSTFQGRFIRRGERNITSDGFNSCSARLMPPHSILFTSRAPIGYVAIAENEVCTNQGFKSIVPNADTDYLFLYYLLVHNRGRIENLGSGTTFKEVSGSVMKGITVSVPTDIEEQKAIARVLGSLDDKIENNTAINNHLEQMAQAIFKSWFVDFEPWGGVMPGNWFTCTIGDLSSEVNTRLSEGFDIEVLSAVKTGELIPSSDYFTKQVYSKELTRYKVVEPNDFAYNPMRINIGSIGANEREKTCCVSPDYVVFRANKGFHFFLRLVIKSSRFLEAVSTFVSGSVRQRVYYKQLQMIETICPDSGTLAEFNEVYGAIITSMNEAKRENASLANLRDTLLPRLMSGDLSVSDLADTK